MVVMRALREEDEPQWAELWRAYLAFYETTLPEEIYRCYFQRLLSSDPRDYKGLVAEDPSGKLIGLTHFLYHRHGWKMEDVCYLQDLYVVPQARGFGAGRALIEAVYKEAREAHVGQVYWLTQEFNHEARHLYDRLATLTPFIKYQWP